MCGIAGCMRISGDGTRDEAIVESMIALLGHRGPDGYGVIRSGRCTLGHRRLSVIDLTDAGLQPMSYHGHCITYNGEVYNFQELKREHRLAEEGAPFRSRTDTEVVLRLFSKLGAEAFQHLNGMFAMGAWNAQTATLSLARDAFGIKPLFYMRDADALWFASEIKALLEVPGQVRQANLQALWDFLSLNYVPGEQTPFIGITELRPGHCLTVRADDGRASIAPIFDWTYPEDLELAAAEATQAVAAELRAAVTRHLISDVPVGVMLSGGLDSSALTAMVREIRGDGCFHTYSLAFRERSFDESSYAQKVAEHVGSRHQEILVCPHEVQELIPTYLAHIDEPYGDGSAIPTWLLSRCASADVTVLLSGEGGDELFAGYDTHAAWRARKYYRAAVPGLVRRGIIKWAVHQLPVSYDKLSFEFKAKRFADGAELSVPASQFFWRVVLTEDAKREIVQTDGLSVHPIPTTELFEKAFGRAKAKSELNRLLYLDSQYHLPDDLMIKNDRMTMAHSLEARVPFTDVQLFKFLSRLSPDLKMRRMKRKYVLRKALQAYLPHDVIEKKKVGLELPYSKWIRGPWRDFVGDVLDRRRLDDTGILRGNAVRRMLEDHWAGRADFGRPLWGLINLLVWHDNYISSNCYRSLIRPARAARRIGHFDLPAAAQ
jgi:asparagine synthase (glutamine-hydrolysing)